MRRRGRIRKMRKSRGWLLLALCVAPASVGTTFAQQTDAPPPPVPFVPSDAPPPSRLPAPLQPSVVPNAPPLTVPPPPPQPHPPLFSEADPLLERPQLPPP